MIAVEHRLVVGERRQHQAGQLGSGGSDLPADLDAVPSGSRTSSTATSGWLRGSGRAPGPTVPASPTTSRSALGLEQVTDAATNDLVIVEQKDADRHLRPFCWTESSAMPAPVVRNEACRTIGPVSNEGYAGPRQLRRLLDAVLEVGSDLDLETTLRRITEAAVQISGAHYGALGVLDDSGDAIGRVRHRRDRRRGPSPDRRICRKATGSSEFSSPTRVPFVSRTCVSTPTATGFRRTTRR